MFFWTHGFQTHNTHISFLSFLNFLSIAAITNITTHWKSNQQLLWGCKVLRKEKRPRESVAIYDNDGDVQFQNIESHWTYSIEKTWARLSVSGKQRLHLLCLFAEAKSDKLQLMTLSLIYMRWYWQQRAQEIMNTVDGKLLHIARRLIWDKIENWFLILYAWPTHSQLSSISDC